MNETQQSRILDLLKKTFPEYENRLEYLYSRDPILREIAREYLECIRKQELSFKDSGKETDYYSETIRELHDELKEYLTDKLSNSNSNSVKNH